MGYLLTLLGVIIFGIGLVLMPYGVAMLVNYFGWQVLILIVCPFLILGLLGLITTDHHRPF